MPSEAVRASREPAERVFPGAQIVDRPRRGQRTEHAVPVPIRRRPSSRSPTLRASSMTASASSERAPWRSGRGPARAPASAQTTADRRSGPARLPARQVGAESVTAGSAPARPVAPPRGVEHGRWLPAATAVPMNVPADRTGRHLVHDRCAADHAGQRQAAGDRLRDDHQIGSTSKCSIANMPPVRPKPVEPRRPPGRSRARRRFDGDPRRARGRGMNPPSPCSARRRSPRCDAARRVS